MAQPPFPAPARCQVVGVLPGEFGAADGGWLSTFDGEVSVRIDGDPGGVFSVVGLETFALKISHDPDLPPGPHPPSWQSLSGVEGAGPITVRRNEALVVTIGFGCPAGSAQEVYDASGVVVGDDRPLDSLPIDAQVASIVGLRLGRFVDQRKEVVDFDPIAIAVPHDLNSANSPTSAQLVAVAQISDGSTRNLDPASVSWASTSPEFATIDSEGLAQGREVGQTDIVAILKGREPLTNRVHMSVY